MAEEYVIPTRAEANEIAKAVGKVNELTGGGAPASAAGPRGPMTPRNLPVVPILVRLTGGDAATGATYTLADPVIGDVAEPRDGGQTDAELGKAYEVNGREPEVGANVFLTFRPDADGVMVPVYQLVSGEILVNLTEDGTGSAGDATTACTFKYDVYPFEGGAALATGVSPWFGRGAGQKNPATRGMARYVGGTLLLIQTDESLVIRTGGCS